MDGGFPDELYEITSFKSVDIGLNRFSGDLSPKIAQWKDLTIYAADNNIFQGKLPTSISKMTKLEYFNIYNNYYNGSVGTLFQNMMNMTVLDVGNNFFTGGFPYIQPLKKLRYFNVELNGHFSDSIGLTGEIPTYIGKMNLLEYLDVSNNNFTGPIPTEIGNLVRLKKLDMHSNEISGAVPPEIENSNSLGKNNCTSI